MRYLSVCSGIEAASVAWHPLGWEPVAFAEIDRFPSAVLAHRFPHVPNLGDFTTITEADLGQPVSLLVGGTPCQSFSVAGLRRGMADPRGNLALAYLRLADLLRPRWVVWENVPGVLSSNGGRDFGAFLGALGQLGYGFAYRVLDAQYVRVDGFGRAVPQRRRRVFVVGHLGDWRRAAAVLLEPESMSGHPAPRREKGASVAGTLEARASTGGYDPGAHGAASGHLVPEVADTLLARYAKSAATSGKDSTVRNVIPEAYQCHGNNVGPMGTLRSGNGNTAGGVPFIPECAHTLKAEGFDASEDGTGRGVPIVPLAFTCKDSGQDAGEVAPTLRSMSDNGHPNGGGQVAVCLNWRVRRLTPVECERLQGFPDGWTDIPWRNKPHAPDGPRYKAIGNSMAVNVMRWIGRRIAMVEATP